MNRKRITTLILLMIFILASLLPTIEVSAATNETITLNSSLYKAVKAQLETQGVYASYNDAQYTMTLSQDAINSLTELNLSNKGISDLTGLDKFANVTSVDLSANDLSKDSHLEVLNSFNLKFLDLSSNEISDVSAITGINNIETVNLHNQNFNEAIVINNKMVKEGTIKTECELPQIVRDFAKPIKSEWLQDSYLPNGTSVKFDWSSFNSSSDAVKLIIGDTNGNQYTGLATLKIKIDDMSNKLYNSEINLYYVVINENQRAIMMKDKNLYDAVKAQLTRGQNINSDLTSYTRTANLYDQAYDEQMILVINENDLVNKITSLVLDQKRIKDLTGIEMFIGLEEELNVSSNYINTIDRIVDLQAMKDKEEAELQARFKEKAAQLKERVDELQAKESELEAAQKELDSANKEKNAANSEAQTAKTAYDNAVENVEDLKAKLEDVITKYNEEVEDFNNVTLSYANDDGERARATYLFSMVGYGKEYIEYTGSKIKLWSTNEQEYSISDLDALENKIEQSGFYWDNAESDGTRRDARNLSTPVEYKSGKIYDATNTANELNKAYITASSKAKDPTIQDKIDAANKKISEINSEIMTIKRKITTKTLEIYELYNNTYKVTSVITPELKNMTDEEYDNLNLEQAKALLQAQVTKLTAIEKYFTEAEKAGLKYYVYSGLDFSDKTKTPVATYYKDRLKVLEENKNVTEYKAELTALRKLDAFVTASNQCLIYHYMNPSSNSCVANFDNEIALKTDDGEKVAISYLQEGLTRHRNNCSYKASVSDEDLVAVAGRIANATDSDIAAYVVLPRLHNLNMTENLIENMDQISVMKELRKLYMGENEIVNINNIDWSAMPMLNTLNLSFNNISEIKVLEVLKNLKALDLSKNLISGSFDFTISDMKKLASLNLSSNQIDDIEYLKSQYEFIAKDHNMEISEFLKSDKAPSIKLNSQSLSMDATVEKTASTLKIELPKIFSQFEELQWEETSFGITSLYGNVTSDGKYVLLDISTLGTKTANVTVIGGIGSGTSCSIVYKVVEEGASNPGEDPDTTEIVITINTNDGSSIEGTKEINDTNYILVSENTSVSQVLNNITLNTEAYKLVVKDSNNENTVGETEKLKTNQTVVIDGLEDKAKCVIVVKGDITGDGQIGMSDILKLNQYRNQKATLTDAEVLAGNVVDTDDEINMSDILKLNQYRVNKIDSL